MASTSRCLLALAVALLPAAAAAEIELTSGLSLGGGVVLPEAADEGLFRFGGHLEATFLRRTNRDFGLGLYVESMTSGFRDVTGSVGALAVLPVHHGAPLVVFFGPHYTWAGEHDAGVGGRLWWGARNHNHFHPYNFTAGVWVEVRGSLLADRGVLVAAGVDIDPALFVYPFLWLERWARGPSRL